MKVLLTGAGGQLGYELIRSLPDTFALTALTHQQLDIADNVQVEKIISQFQPQVIVNAAAYTAVDAAESNPQLCHAINAQGAANLANAALKNHARLIHISTDFVFDGAKSTPYLPTDQPNPLSEYGKSKWEAEKLLQEIAPQQTLILRCGWVYSKHGNNFVKTILKLIQQKPQLGVIADQIGTPTSAKLLALAIWQMLKENDLNGIYHWSDAGVASWYDFAVAIQEESFKLGYLQREINIQAITSAEYPLPAKRPFYSVLNKSTTWNDFKLQPVHWRAALRNMLMELEG